jgi:hypothetical protein
MVQPLSHALVGTWQLVSITALQANGAVTADVYGVSPVGYLTYTATGHMVVLFSRGDRPLLSGNPTSPFSLESVPVAELGQAFASFSAYAGTYTVEGNAVHHHLSVASIPNRVGATLVRSFVLSGDSLTLTTPETQAQGIATAYRLVWQRASASS